MFSFLQVNVFLYQCLALMAVIVMSSSGNQHPDELIRAELAQKLELTVPEVTVRFPPTQTVHTDWAASRKHCEHT
jgi:hypothetical protein